MRFEHVTSAALAVGQQIAHSVSVPEPVKTAAYATVAAIVGWAVGVALSWIAKRLGLNHGQ